MLRTLLTAAAVLATGALAQTTTDCNPLNSTTCPVDTALGIKNYTWNLAQQSSLDSVVWNNTGGLTPDFGSNMMNFTITKSGNAPSFKSNFYYFFGTATVIMRAAPGTGIISAMTALSDDLDEIDFEFKGGNDSYVFTNYYGKYQPNMAGNGTDVKLPFDPRSDFHNYTQVWSNTSIEWYVDGQQVRQLMWNDPSTQNGLHYPQTPMRLHIGSWAAGDSSEPDGVRAWAGGNTDYSKGPFAMSVSQVYVSDASSGSTYTYGDKSGSWQSIKTAPGNSTIANHLASGSSGSSSGSISQSIENKVSSLSSSAKIGIAIGALSFLALLLIAFAVCCIKQRRAGRKERAVADAEFQKHEAELMAYRMQQQSRPGVMPAFGYQDFRGRR